MPFCFERHLGLWRDLHQGRFIVMGLTPLSWVDLAAFTAVTGEPLSSADVRVIRIIEDEFHASRAAAEERKGG